MENNKYFIFTRRTASQVKKLMNPKLNPFKALNRDKGWDYQAVHVAEDIYTFTPCTEETTERGRRKVVPCGDDIATIVPLSTFSTTRGFDVAEAESWLVDELIPERNERPIQDEGTCYLNAYESMNRNRELAGVPPIKAVFMCNSNTLKNPLLLELELVGIIAQMEKNGQSVLHIRERSLCIIKLRDSPISAAKKDTVLYKLTRGTNFHKMAIENEFAEDVASETKEMNYLALSKNYKPVVRVGEISLYESANPDIKKPYYVSRVHRIPDHLSPHYSADATNNARFIHNNLYLYHAYMRDEIIFQDYLSELLFQQYFKKS